MEKFQRQSVRLHELKQHGVCVYQPPLIRKAYDPVVFYIHGGAWHLGNVANAQPACRALADRGYVAVAASYPLSSFSNAQIEVALTVVIVLMATLGFTAANTSQLILVMVLTAGLIMFIVALWMYVPRENVKHPDHVRELAKKVKWTVDHIEEYGGNPRHIYLMGHSAGGHLAALLGTNFHYLSDAGVPEEYIRGCIPLSGVYSDKRLQETVLGRQLLLNAFGDHQVYHDAFPIYNLSEQTPPFLLINAGWDVSLKRHTYDFHHRLQANGTFVETAYFNELNHYNIVLHWNKHNKAVLDKIEQFLQEVEAWHNTNYETNDSKSRPSLETNESKDRPSSEPQIPKDRLNESSKRAWCSKNEVSLAVKGGEESIDLSVESAVVAAEEV